MDTRASRHPTWMPERREIDVSYAGTVTSRYSKWMPGLAKRSLGHNYIDHFLVLMLLKEFIYWSGHFPLPVSFDRLPFYCLVPCNVRLQLHQNVHFCLALAACTFICLSHRLVFMDSQVQSYQGANGSRPPLDFLQCIADNVSDDLPSYTKLKMT